MAKRKNQKLSAEELLEQALVPEEEQPYEVPENWVWIKLEPLIDTLNGYPFDSELFSNKPSDGFPLIRIRDVVRGYTETYTSQECSEIYHVKTGDILIGMDGDFNIATWKSGVSYLNQRVCKIKSVNNRVLLDKYMLYYLPRPLKEIQDTTSSVTVKHLSVKNIQAIAFPLPPISEQQRIVDRIENLFTKLDQAKEIAQNALDSFETRKAAILHKAFSGELTAKWREEHGVSRESWVQSNLSSVCKSIFDGDHMPPPKSESGVPFLVISNINKGFLSFENTRHVPYEYYDKLSESRKPELGDVLYSIVGSYGIPVIVDDDKDFCFQRHIALLKPSNIETRFLWYLLQTNMMFQKVTEIATGTAQLTVPIKGLRQISFELPTMFEQQEIIRLLDNLLRKEQKAIQLVDVLEKIELLKKAILARAFRGELGTNDPSEENELKMLKEVIVAQ